MIGAFEILLLAYVVSLAQTHKISQIKKKRNEGIDKQCLTHSKYSIIITIIYNFIRYLLSVSKNMASLIIIRNN